MSKDTVNKVLDVCEKNNIYYMVYTNKELIVRSVKHMTMFFYKQNYNYIQKCFALFKEKQIFCHSYGRCL